MLYIAAVAALKGATEDADTTGTGYVRITAVRVHDGIHYDIVRLDPETVYERTDEPVPPLRSKQGAPELQDARPIRKPCECGCGGTDEPNFAGCLEGA